jgi:hypothetical protein
MITRRDVEAMAELLNRLPKTTAEALWCQAFLRSLVAMIEGPVEAEPPAEQEEVS